MRVSVELLDYDDRDEEIANRPLFRKYNRERTGILDRKSTRLNSSHSGESRMPSSA